MRNGIAETAQPRVEKECMDDYLPAWLALALCKVQSLVKQQHSDIWVNIAEFLVTPESKRTHIRGDRMSVTHHNHLYKCSPRIAS